MGIRRSFLIIAYVGKGNPSNTNRRKIPGRVRYPFPWTGASRRPGRGPPPPPGPGSSLLVRVEYDLLVGSIHVPQNVGLINVELTFLTPERYSSSILRIIHSSAHSSTVRLFPSDTVGAFSTTTPPLPPSHVPCNDTPSSPERQRKQKLRSGWERPVVKAFRPHPFRPM